MLNKAMKLMEQRQAMISEAREVLTVLGAENAPVAPVVINKGQIVAVTDPRDQEEIDNLYREIGRHIGRINQLVAENEELKDELYEKQLKIDMQQEELGYYHEKEEEYNQDVREMQKDNEQLRKELAALKQNNKGGDAMEQPKEQPKKNMPSFLQQVMKAEQQKKDNAEKDIVKEALETKEVVEETNEVKINWTQDVFDEKVNDFSCMMMGVHGDITINDKSYKFKARREFHMPIIYGCFDEEVVRIAREEINRIDRFRLSAERTTNDVNFKYAQDKEYPIVAWRLTEDNGNIVYHAYAKLMNHQMITLTWDKNQLKHILKAGVKSLSLDNSKRTPWRKLDNETLADKFMAVCADIWPEDFAKEEPQETNEIVVDFTEDPTAGCDDLDI